MKTIVDFELLELIKNNMIEHINKEIKLEKYIQPASLDIPIGNKIYLIKKKFLPFNSKIENILKHNIIKEFDLNKTKSQILYKGQTYLIPTLKIKLNKNQLIKISPKSSIGRVDLMVRGIFDNTGLYDIIFENSTGILYLEVTPQSFNIEIEKGIPISQLRIFEIKNQEIKEKEDSSKKNQNQSIKKINFLYDNSKNPISTKPFEKNKYILSINIDPNISKSKIIGFKAKDTNQIINLSKINYYNPDEFFEKIIIKNQNQITLEKDKFYILHTKENIYVPKEFSIEMIPFSHLIGELRAHYAGFFDPGFGSNKLSTGVLEIRPHETLTIYDGQPICLIEIYKNKDIPNKLYGENNNYQFQQGPKLAKYFKQNFIK